MYYLRVEYDLRVRFPLIVNNIDCKIKLSHLIGEIS